MVNYYKKEITLVRKQAKQEKLIRKTHCNARNPVFELNQLKSRIIL